MWNIYFTFLAILVSKTTFGSDTAPSEVLFVISSQNSSPYHRQLSENIRDNIQRQSKALTDYKVSVCLSFEVFDHPRHWNLLNVLPRLQDGQFVNNNTKWIIVCEDRTEIQVKTLLTELSFESHHEPLLLGYPLYDKEATIIHHFAFFENSKWFPYPLLRSGVILSAGLLKSLVSILSGDKGKSPPIGSTDFSIDSAHELARFIFENIHVKINSSLHYPSILLESSRESSRSESVRKVILRKPPYICKTQNRALNSAVRCAMYAKPVAATHAKNCMFSIQPEQVFVAIKTCEKFHKKRIPIIEATWAPYVAHKRYYSDVAASILLDDTIPTISTGIPNVETGHCDKTLAILKLALEEINQTNEAMKRNDAPIRWLLLADDDTLVSMTRLCGMLRCLNHTEMGYLGERYGYRLHAKDGFNYVTGGGGIVLSIPTVRLIVEHCSCPTSISPDDMILGSCLHALGIEPIHSSQFHQARPNDYPRELFELDQPISFHKFWQQDPLQVYKRWLEEDADRKMLSDEILKSKSSQWRDVSTITSKNSSNNLSWGSKETIHASVSSFKQESNSHEDL